MSFEYQPNEPAPHKSNDEIADSSQKIPKTVIPFSVVAEPANASVRIGNRNWIFYYSDNTESISYIVGTGFDFRQYEEFPVKLDNRVRGSRGSPIAAVVVEGGTPSVALIHLFFIDDQRRLREVILDPNSKKFDAGTLDNHNIFVSAGSGISALGSAQVTESGFFVFLFYCPFEIPGTIHLAARAGQDHWSSYRLSPFN